MEGSSMESNSKDSSRRKTSSSLFMLSIRYFAGSLKSVSASAMSASSRTVSGNARESKVRIWRVISSARQNRITPWLS